MAEFVSYTIYILHALMMAKIFERCVQLKWGISKGIYFFVIIMISSLLAAFRGATGTDSEMYRRAYEIGVDNVFRWQNFEIGFIKLIELLHKFKFPYQMLFFVMSAITTCLVLIWINMERNCINVKLSVFIYFITLYLYSFNAMRQSVAIAMCLCAIGLFVNKHKILSVGLILFASFFHLSAMMALIVLGAKTVFESKYRYYFMCVIFGVAFYLVAHRDQFGMIVKLITGSGYYALYITRDAYTEGSLLGYYIKIFPFLLISGLNLSNYKKYPSMYTYFGLMICGYIISSLGSITATQVGRMGDYFTYLNIVVLGFCSTQAMPIPIYKSGRKIKIGKNMITLIIYLYVLVYTTYNVLIRNFGEYLPYQGIFK